MYQWVNKKTLIISKCTVRLEKKSICTAIPHILFHVQPFFSEEFTSTHFPACGQMISMCVSSSVLNITSNFLYLPIWLQIHINRLMTKGFIWCLFLFRYGTFINICDSIPWESIRKWTVWHTRYRNVDNWMRIQRRTINIEEKSMARSLLSIVL